MTERRKTYWAKLYQDGIDVAGVTGPDKQAVEREIQHYAAVYSQDGPVKIRRGSATLRTPTVSNGEST
jgi:hypothetical protein